MSRGDSELLEGETTGAVIGGFRTVHRTLGFGYREHIYSLALEIKTGEHLASTSRDQPFSYLCSTNIEVGLLLHFGRKPTFRRVFCENRFKLHGPVDGAIRRPDDPKSR